MEQYVDLFVNGFVLGFSIILYVGMIPAALNAVWSLLDITK